MKTSELSNKDLIVQRLYDEIRHGLTPSGRKLLQVILSNGHEMLTRNRIAHLTGKARLTRYDIELLKLLEDRGYIVADRQRVFDERENMPPTWNYIYRVNPRFRPYFDEISRRARRQAEPDSKPLFQRLRDLIM